MAPVDCTLVLGHDHAAQDVGTKTPLVVDPQCVDGSGAATWGILAGGASVGHLSQDDLRRAQAAVGTSGCGVNAAVRSVRRDPVTKQITSVQVQYQCHASWHPFLRA
jgi:hypothetical protein